MRCGIPLNTNSPCGAGVHYMRMEIGTFDARERTVRIDTGKIGVDCSGCKISNMKLELSDQCDLA